MPQYVADMVTLIARLDVEQVHWVGTSMGGLIGMALAAQQHTPITRLVLNDVGPVVTAVSMARIAEYVGNDPRFDSLEQAEQFVRAVSPTFGRLTDAQWRHLTEHVVRTGVDGKIEFRYDPGIAEPFRPSMGEGGHLELCVRRHPLPDAGARGGAVGLAAAETVAQMAQRAHAQTAEIPDVSHTRRC